MTTTTSRLGFGACATVTALSVLSRSALSGSAEAAEPPPTVPRATDAGTRSAGAGGTAQTRSSLGGTGLSAAIAGGGATSAQANVAGAGGGTARSSAVAGAGGAQGTNADYEAPLTFVEVEGFDGWWRGELSRYSYHPLGIRVAVGLVPEDTHWRIGLDAAYTIATPRAELTSTSEEESGTSDRFQVTEIGLVTKYYLDFWHPSFGPKTWSIGFGVHVGVSYWDRMRIIEPCDRQTPSCFAVRNIGGRVGPVVALPVELYLGDVESFGLRVGLRPSLYSLGSDTPTLAIPVIVGVTF